MDSDLINTEVAVVVAVVVAAKITGCRVWGGGVLGWQGGEVITDTGLYLLFVNGKLIDFLFSASMPTAPSHLIIAQSSTAKGSRLFICFFCEKKKFKMSYIFQDYSSQCLLYFKTQVNSSLHKIYRKLWFKVNNLCQKKK